MKSLVFFFCVCVCVTPIYCFWLQSCFQVYFVIVMILCTSQFTYSLWENLTFASQCYRKYRILLVKANTAFILIACIWHFHIKKLQESKFEYYKINKQINFLADDESCNTSASVRYCAYLDMFMCMHTCMYMYKVSFNLVDGNHKLNVILQNLFKIEIHSSCCWPLSKLKEINSISQF